MRPRRTDRFGILLRNRSGARGVPVRQLNRDIASSVFEEMIDVVGVGCVFEKAMSTSWLVPGLINDRRGKGSTEP